MERGTWQATVHGVAKSQPRLRDWAYNQHSGLPSGTSGKEPACKSRGCKKRRSDPWVRKISWRSAWKPISVFLPGECHGQRSLECYSPGGCKDWKWLKRLSMHACMHSQSPDMKISLWVTLYFMETSLLLYRYQALRDSLELCFTFLWPCFTPIGSFFTWYFYNSLQFSGFLFDSGTCNYGCLAQKKQQTYRAVFFLHNNVCRFVGLLQLFRVLV